MDTINAQDWAAKTAMRLRIVQGTKVESDSPDRGSEVWEFIALAVRELDHLTADQRRVYMRALDQEFPFFEDREQVVGAGRVDPPVTVVGPVREAVTAAELIQQLLDCAATLTPEEREKYSQSLLDGGFKVEQMQVVQAEGSLQAAVALPIYEEEHARLKKVVDRIIDKLGKDVVTRSGRPELNLTRCMQMLGLLCEQYLALHPKVWELWDHLSSSQQYTTSFNRPTLPTAQALLEFLQGKASTRRADVSDMIAKTVFLAAALVTATTEAGAEFSRWFFEKFGPENITSVINFETDGSKAGPADYWKRYCELAQHENESEMKEQFQKLLGKAMLRQLQRRPASIMDTKSER